LQFPYEWRHSTPWFIQSDMSAAVFVYTSDGFIAASDGRSTLGDSREVESDTDTKIFLAESPGMHAAYVLNGLVGRQGSRFDLIAEANRQVASLSSQTFQDVFYYASKLSRQLKRHLGEAKRDGAIIRFPDNTIEPLLGSIVATLFLVG